MPERKGRYDRLGQEPEMQNYDSPHWAPKHETIVCISRRSLLFLIGLSTAVALSLLSATAVVAYQYGEKSHRRYGQPLSADYLPPGKPILRTFEDTFAFGGRRTPRTDANWDSLIPKGGGFIPVTNPQDFGLPNDNRQTSQSDQVQLWGVSVFHQLHCVSMLRRIYWNNIDGISTDAAFVEHAGHCFDFLRQAISCWSDTTLEMPQLRSNSSDVTRASYQSPRQCRNFEEIKRYTEKAYLSMAS